MAHYLHLVDQIKAFWETFARNASSPSSQWLGLLRRRLFELSKTCNEDAMEGLGLETEESADSKSVYLFSIPGLEGQDLAELVVSHAPSIFPWQVRMHRPPRELRACLRAVREDIGQDVSHARARVGVGRGHLINVVLGSHKFSSARDERTLDAATELVRRLLGDAVFNSWVESVDVVVTRKASPLQVVGQADGELPLTLEELAESVDNGVRQITAQLPKHPHHRFCEHAEWNLFELDADQDAAELRDAEPGQEPRLPHYPALTVDDRAAERLPDVSVATTMCPEMLKCFLNGAPLASERFSRFGEVFVYLQLALTGDLKERAASRIGLEDVLNRALVPGGLGCVVGSGMGARFSYVFLALQNVEPAISVIQRRLQAHANKHTLQGHQAWLRFCDTADRREWVGVWADTPAPW